MGGCGWTCRCSAANEREISLILSFFQPVSDELTHVGRDCGAAARHGSGHFERLIVIFTEIDSDPGWVCGRAHDLSLSGAHEIRCLH